MITMVAVDHPEDVLNWRMQELLRMGFNVTAATFLSYTRADLHATQELINKGCPHDLAVRILNDQEEDFEG